MNFNKDHLLNLYQRHRVLVFIIVFTLGFLFDLITLTRVDDIANLIQHAFYLLLLGALLVIEIKMTLGEFTLSEKGQRFWKYNDLFVHFLFGTLLQAYTIFYFSSASTLSSFVFIVLLAGLVLANESDRFQKMGLSVRVILYTICLLSYFVLFFPILMGHVGQIPFWLGFLSSLAMVSLIWHLHFKGKLELRKKVMVPVLAVHFFFLFAYYTSLIPPVPLAVKKIGAYHSLEKKDGKYIGFHTRSIWNNWNRKAQTFKARPEDKLVLLLSIFSPTHFKDEIYLKWYFKHPRKGWELKDTIPLSIVGGREEGFRGFTNKSHYMPGKWRVEVETSDGREVGRLGLTIEKDESTEPRKFKKDFF